MKKVLVEAMIAMSLVGVGCEVAPIPREPTGEELTLANATASHLQGTYSRGETGLQFESEKNGGTGVLVIRSLKGQELLRVESQSKETKMVVLERYSETSPDESQAVDAQGDAKAVSDLSSFPEYRILPWLSRSLGGRGITGVDYPSSYSLHMLSMNAANELGIEVPTDDPRPPEAGGQLDTSSPLTEVRANKGGSLICDGNGAMCNQGNCPSPKPWNMGMCGPNSTCWSWVCGDCCAYQGCHFHDVMCGKYGMGPCIKNAVLWFGLGGGCKPKFGLGKYHTIQVTP